MLNLLIRYALAAGTILFLVSLPLGKFEIASKLRHMSGALFILAFAPYLFCDLVRALPQGGPHGVTPSISIGGPSILEIIGALALMTPVAYAILALRHRIHSAPKDAWSEFRHARSSGKQPVERNTGAATGPSLFDAEDEEEVR